MMRVIGEGAAIDKKIHRNIKLNINSIQLTKKIKYITITRILNCKTQSKLSLSTQIIPKIIPIHLQIMNSFRCKKIFNHNKNENQVGNQNKTVKFLKEVNSRLNLLVILLSQLKKTK